MNTPNTVIGILGGLGLFLLGMAVMTDGLRALAGSALRDVLARAVSTPARGTLWGAVITFIVQSSSATTMTTIGLVSAGLLTFPQALGVIFGANIGTTGTGWLAALLGVKFSLTPTAMPMLFAGALLRLLSKGRWGGAGGAIAGFAMLLLGLTVLQDGMAGLAARVEPADLPTVSEAGSLLRAWLNIAILVLAGIIMTTVMQSSSAAVAATILALHAGAIGPDQAAALVIGQNIGSAISSAIAAIGATTPAKRTALAHVMFNALTGVVFIAAFPFLAPWIVAAAERLDNAILLATLHTLYNFIGVGMLLPLVRPFSRLIERIVRQRGPVLTRFLDRSVLTIPAVAVEAARRSLAGTLNAVCTSLATGLRADHAPHRRGHRAAPDRLLLEQAAEATGEIRAFLSGLADPPTNAEERQRLSDALHALDHVASLVAAAREQPATDRPVDDPDARTAAALAAESLDAAAAWASQVADPALPEPPPGIAAQLGDRSARLAELRRSHRRATLSLIGQRDTAAGLTADHAIARVDTVRRLDRLAYHAWRAVVHLSGEAAASPERVEPGEPEATVEHARNPSSDPISS